MEKGQEARRRSKAKDQETDFSSRKASASGKSLPHLDSEGNSLGEAFEPMETDPDGRSLALAKEKNLDRNILIASSDKDCNISEGTAEDVRSPALSCSSDTDGEHLIIDAEREPGHTSQPGAVPSNPSPGGSAPPSPSPGQAFLSEKPAESSETQAKTSPCKLRPRLSQKIDPLGQILKMQTKLLKPPSPNSQGHLPVTSERSSNPTQGQADAPSLPLASSAVEPGQTTVTNAGTASKFTWATCYQGPQKGRLCDG